MPRATLSRLPQIIRVNAPARPQPPALAVPAAAAKPSVSPAFPIAGAGATPAADTKGLKTPVRSAWAGVSHQPSVCLHVHLLTNHPFCSETTSDY